MVRFGLVIGFAVLFCLPPCKAGLDHFENTGSMNFARSHFAATLLRDGKVLIEGGDNSALVSTELFDLTTGR